MTTISVPVSPDTEEFINRQVKEGKASNKADIIRRALKRFEEEEAVQIVLNAQREPDLKGDLKVLAKKIK